MSRPAARRAFHVAEPRPPQRGRPVAVHRSSAGSSALDACRGGGTVSGAAVPAMAVGRASLPDSSFSVIAILT